MPPAAIAPTILVLAALALLLGASQVRWRRFSGSGCLIALALTGYGLSVASHAIAEPVTQRAADNNEANRAANVTAELKLDSFSLTICWAAVVLGLLLVLPTLRLQSSGFGAPERYAGLLFSIAGLMVVAMSRDLIVLALALELVTLPMLQFRATQRLTRSTLEGVARFLTLGMLSAALLWFGLAILYGMAGTTRMPDCFDIIAGGRIAVEPASLAGGTIQLGVPAAILILAGLGMKTGLVPFHFGTPELADGSSIWQASISATIIRGAGIIAAWRLFGPTWGESDQTIAMMLSVVAGLTMLVGAAMACTQIRIRRLLVYSGMAHTGNALLGVTVNATAGFYYLGGFLFAMAGLFALLNYLSRQNREVEFIDDLSGLFRREPIAALCGTVCLLTLAGLPPLPLFWGNLTLLLSVLTESTGSVESAGMMLDARFATMAAATAISSLLLAAAYLQLVAAMLLNIQIARPQPAGGFLALAAGVIAALPMLGLGFWPAPLLEHLGRVLHAASR